MPIRDRENLSRFYQAYNRNFALSYAAGLYLSLETVLRVPQLRKLAVGWRVLSFFGLGLAYKQGINIYISQYYGPIFSAFFRKYQSAARTDPFEITDRKREYFDIDTSDYMNYTNESLGHEYHGSYGPQPDGENNDSSWLVEVDKFL